MSIKKFENVERELISQEDIDSEKISAKSSRCSCLNCDPAGCFEKRKKAVNDRCQCGICRDLRKKSSLHNKDYQQNKGDLESATKKIIREVVTRETIESLKRVTETMYEFGNNEHFGMNMKRQSKLSDTKVMPTKSQVSIKVECIRKTSIEDNNINRNIESCKQRPILQAPSTNITEREKENFTATKLSAQVMNVPYEDLHETIPSSHELKEQNPLSKLNVFKRIKEIYDACSCKVCECISSKPREIQDDFCNCKPCQCQDCVKLRRKIEEKIKRIPHSGCPCIRCDRKDCRGIAKNTCEPQPCDCSPSDGIQYSEMLTKRCKCEPCQCINCKLSSLRTSKTVKLGQLDAYIQRETCQCSPCECIECKQIYNRTIPTIMYTHGSDVNKYGNFCRCHNCTERCQFGKTEICKCDTHNIPLRKSFNKNYNDYDIRTVIVDNNGPFNQQKESAVKKQNTVALFASFKNNYPSNSCNRGVCKCTECECIVCSAKDDSSRNRRDHFMHNVMSLNNDIKLSTSTTNACKCTPCECQICSKKGECEDNIAFERKCRCDVCDCLNCDNALLVTSSFPSSSTPRQSYSNYGHSRQPAKPIRSMDMNKNCNCNPCDCRNCKKLFSCSSSVKFYSGGKTVERKTQRSRKVMLITPSTSEAHLKSQKTYVQSVSSTTLSPKQSTEGVFRQDLSTCHAVSHNYVPVSNLSHTNKNEVCQLYQDMEYNVIVDDEVDGDTFFKLNNPVLDTASIKSIDEKPILQYPCNFTQSGFKSHKIVNQGEVKLSEEKYKHYFNIIHEQPGKIISNDSDESLPVFWACCDRTSYPKSNSRNLRITCEKTSSNLKDNLSNRLNKTLCSKNKQDDFNEKTKEKTQNQVFEDKKFKIDDAFMECVEDSNRHYNFACENEHVNLPPESEKYTDSFSTSFEDNKQEYGKITLTHSDVAIDYERATRVLCEAKAFSSKLIKMLDSFETANRQFESASQKFKVLHESLLNINESELNKTYSTSLGKTPRSIFENTFDMISEVTLDNNQPVDKCVKNENEAEREYEQSATKTENICDNFKFLEDFSRSETNSINMKVEKVNDIKLEQKSEINTFNNNNIIDKLDSRTEFEKFNSIQILPTSKSLHEHVSEFTNHDLKETDYNDEIRNKMENVNVQNIIPKEKHTMATVMKKLDSVFGNITTTNTDTAVATDDVKLNLMELTKHQDKQILQIFKKNLYLNLCPKNKKTILQSPALELDIKEAIQAISMQTANESYAKVVPRPNEALTNLQSEVKDLLNMPLLQINSKFKCKAEPDGHLFPKSKFDLEVKSFSSSASSQTYDRIIKKADKEVSFNIHSEKSKVSCDQLKANFVGLRRVSDHTVLVKWNVPERIADVQGYELLVDGRAVQKIFSPTRNMAVVTCLPPAARVLLTVRTIAAASADCGHAPASTIVYRPRMK